MDAAAHMQDPLIPPNPEAFDPVPGATILLQQVDFLFQKNRLVVDLLDRIGAMVIVLNAHRQVVFINKAMMDFVGAERREVVNGIRPGEMLDCSHADQGCGTTRFCRTCGAARAILSSLHGDDDVQECRIIQADGHSLDLRVTAMPLQIGTQHFTIFTAQDISHEKRRQVLERIFFHDILNTAGTLKGFSEILEYATPAEVQYIQSHLKRTTNRLIEEINAQKELVAAEMGELRPGWKQVETDALLSEMQEQYTYHEAAIGRIIAVAPLRESIVFTTDPVLLGRVLGNLIKNALEAALPSQKVTLSSWREGEMVVFSVHNPTAMPRDIELQIFQRSFSTKGPGRGIGTYSVKLLTERYLQGQVSFNTSAPRGTTFMLRLPITPQKTPAGAH
jgi:signal transduction histidine kinase